MAVFGFKLIFEKVTVTNEKVTEKKWIFRADYGKMILSCTGGFPDNGI